MKPALGHVTCGLGGAGGLRLAVVGAGWLGCVCCAVCRCVLCVCGEDARRAMCAWDCLWMWFVFAFSLLAGGLVEWRLNWLVEFVSGVLCEFVSARRAMSGAGATLKMM